MRPLASLILVLTLAAGCASTAGTTISVDRVALALAVGDARAQYAVIAAQLAQACEAKTLSEATCATLAAGKKEAEMIYKQIRKALTAPPAKGGGSIDMEQMGEYFGVILKLAGKAAL